MSPSDDPHRAPPPAADPAWWAYGDTMLVFPTAATPLGVDLRHPLPAVVPARLQAHVGGSRFGVVTPADPAGQPLDAAANASRLAAFAAELHAAGLPAVPADGCDPAATHREPGFAVVAPQPTVRALAARWGQTAFYWFDGDRVWLVPTHPAYPALPLPTTAAALAAVARNPPPVAP
ncbi:MAG: DUF3293 domain-containing protein [Gemmatimonadaceae bacterium]|jgi:hypothetical protein|nr:DUF3293 domain-containing protein [Gemmatimonadaceae bacterium]